MIVTNYRLETKEGMVVFEQKLEAGSDPRGLILPSVGDAIQLQVNDLFVEYYVHSRFFRQKDAEKEEFNAIVVVIRRPLQWLPTPK